MLLAGERRRRLSRADALRFLELVAALPLEVDRAPAAREAGDAFALGHAHWLSAYDAAYLALAARERLPLATRDRSLRAAARAAGVELFAR